MKKILGKVSITPKGNYNNATTYERLDLVTDSGSSYLSLVDDNTEPLNDVNSWQLIAQGSSGGGGADLMINTTHADLLALVNNSELVAGQQYRITDYVATVDTNTYDFARSNNHAFDIIVTADSVNKLNENARAIRHEGDTYFPSHTKFEAWKLKYTIFNDSDRFDWALSSGKGVVYQLIDEWNNDVSYDFKSIQFKRDSNWVYTFGGGSDVSLSGVIINNKIMYSLNLQNPLIRVLPNNIVNSQFSFLNTFGLLCISNTFGNNCQINTFGDRCQSNTFGNDCGGNILGSSCNSNTFGDRCQLNTFGNDCSNLIIENNPPCRFKVGDGVSNINLSAQLSNFTTPPNGNTVEVYKTVNGVAFRQEVSAGVFETFDVI